MMNTHYMTPPSAQLPPVESLSLMQCMTPQEPLHQFVKPNIGTVGEQLSPAVRCPY